MINKELNENIINRKAQSTMYSLFENKKLLNFRVDVMAKRKYARPHLSIVLAATGMLVFIMMASVMGSFRGVALWREETLFYNEEDTSGSKQTAEENDYFKNAKVSVLDNILIDQLEGSKFSLAPDEVKLYTIPEDCPDEIVVVTICDQGTKQFGYITEDGEIVWVDGVKTASVILSVKEERIKQLFFENTGKIDCNFELYLKSRP